MYQHVRRHGFRVCSRLTAIAHWYRCSIFTQRKRGNRAENGKMPLTSYSCPGCHRGSTEYEFLLHGPQGESSIVSRAGWKKNGFGKSVQQLRLKGNCIKAHANTYRYTHTVDNGPLAKNGGKGGNYPPIADHITKDCLRSSKRRTFWANVSRNVFLGFWQTAL